MTCAVIGSSMSQKVAIMPPWQMPIGLQWRSSTRKPSWKPRLVAARVERAVDGR